MFERKEMKQLQNLITRSAQFTAIIGIPVALLIIAFREYILRFFGVDFLVGETSLQILVLGQLINVLFGSVGMLLLMTGNQRFSIISLSVSIAINIGLNCLLTPRLGITGTAIASASGIFVWNLSMYFFVRKKLHIRTTAFSFV
jgi:O-antigen/teichoic acid export membrane protein